MNEYARRKKLLTDAGWYQAPGRRSFWLHDRFGVSIQFSTRAAYALQSRSPDWERTGIVIGDEGNVQKGKG